MENAEEMEDAEEGVVGHDQLLFVMINFFFPKYCFYSTSLFIYLL